jgi:hypothetical protein
MATLVDGVVAADEVKDFRLTGQPEERPAEFSEQAP